jgi:hypothetical protein
MEISRAMPTARFDEAPHPADDRAQGHVHVTGSEKEEDIRYAGVFRVGERDQSDEAEGTGGEADYDGFAAPFVVVGDERSSCCDHHSDDIDGHGEELLSTKC